MILDKKETAYITLISFDWRKADLLDSALYLTTVAMTGHLHLRLENLNFSV